MHDLISRILIFANSYGIWNKGVKYVINIKQQGISDDYTFLTKWNKYVKDNWHTQIIIQYKLMWVCDSDWSADTAPGALHIYACSCTKLQTLICVSLYTVKNLFMHNMLFWRQWKQMFYCYRRIPWKSVQRCVRRHSMWMWQSTNEYYQII